MEGGRRVRRWNLLVLSLVLGCNVARNAVLPSSGRPDLDGEDSEDTGEPGDRCGGGELILSEVVAHDDLRFVELWNHGSASVALADYRLSIYLDGRDTPSQSATFEGLLGADRGFVIAMEEEPFIDAYGVSPGAVSDVASATGNDTYELSFVGDGQDEVVDRYGERGVDGSDEPWSFEDASARRDRDVWCGRTKWRSEEWRIGGWDRADPGDR